MKRTSLSLLLITLSIGLFSQPKIRLSQIENITNAGIKSTGVTANKVLTSNNSTSSIWAFPSWSDLLNKPFIPVSIWDMTNISATGWAEGKVLKFNVSGALIVGTDLIGDGGITSLTTTGNSGAATLLTNTLNVPNYTLSGLGYSGALDADNYAQWILSINNGASASGVTSQSTVDLAGAGGTTITRTGNNIVVSSSGGMVYPGVGIPLVTVAGAWSTSIANNSANWNTAYSNMGKVFITGESVGKTLNTTHFYSTVGGAGDQIWLNYGIIASGSAAPVASGDIFTELALKEPTFTKNTGFNKNFGSTTGTVLQGRTFGTAANSNTGDFEPALGNPAANNYVLQSTTAGVRSWVAQSGGTTNHAALSNLAYATSGHTGFAKIAGDIAQAFSAERVNIGAGGWNVYGGVTGSDLEFNYSGVNKGYVTTAGNMVLVGTITGTNFILSSDSTLKQNIKPITFSNIEKIKFVQFDLKADNDHRTRYGVLAQQVESYMPELVYTDNDGMKSVAYIDLLIAKIVELENRLKQLENEK